jgi:hypothetical protein
MRPGQKPGRIFLSIIPVLTACPPGRALVYRVPKCGEPVAARGQLRLVKKSFIRKSLQLSLRKQATKREWERRPHVVRVESAGEPLQGQRKGNVYATRSNSHRGVDCGDELNGCTGGSNSQW